jgi:hypothetical protein
MARREEGSRRSALAIEHEELLSNTTAEAIAVE